MAKCIGANKRKKMLLQLQNKLINRYSEKLPKTIEKLVISDIKRFKFWVKIKFLFTDWKPEDLKTYQRATSRKQRKRHQPDETLFKYNLIDAQ